MIRLGNATLPNANAIRPAYDRSKVTNGIVHLGIGAFARAHLAVYTEAALAAGDRGWGILAASLRSPDTRDALNPQDGLYSLAVRDESGEKLQVIGAVGHVLLAFEDPDRLIAAMAHRDIAIVSLSVTEKGYCHDAASGQLNELHPDILHDLAHPNLPVSAPGFLVAALARRWRDGVPPFTIVSCDNLPGNGRLLKRLLVRLAGLQDPALAQMLEDHLACPCTMVDRIVPATTSEDRARISASLGVRDAWPVVTEPFTQWVIEDDFPLGRPRWELMGAQFVADVAPYEAMKLRLLNGAHSCIAYLGYLSRATTVADAMDLPGMADYVARLMLEILPTLHVPDGFDAVGYCAALIKRFCNPALKHRTWQIAMDGSQKLPQRLLGTMRDRLAAGADIECLGLGVAAWMVYVTGVDLHGDAIDVRDPLAKDLRTLADAAGRDAARLTAALLGVEAVFGRDLPGDARFVAAVTEAVRRVLARGRFWQSAEKIAIRNPGMT